MMSKDNDGGLDVLVETFFHLMMDYKRFYVVILESSRQEEKDTADLYIVYI